MVLACVETVTGAYSAQVVEAQGEEDVGKHVLEENVSSDDEWEAEDQEAVAIMTVGRQRRTSELCCTVNLLHFRFPVTCTPES